MFKWIQGIIQIYGANGNVAEVNTSGELKVVTAPPTTPPGNTSWNITEYGNVNGEEFAYFTVPNGESAIIQRFKASGEGETRNKVELWLDVDGDNPNNSGDIPNSWVLIDLINTSNNFFVSPQDENISYLGDGTLRIALARIRMENGNREIFGKVEGYY